MGGEPFFRSGGPSWEPFKEQNTVLIFFCSALLSFFADHVFFENTSTGACRSRLLVDDPSLARNFSMFFLISGPGIGLYGSSLRNTGKKRSRRSFSECALRFFQHIY